VLVCLLLLLHFEFIAFNLDFFVVDTSVVKFEVLSELFPSRFIVISQRLRQSKVEICEESLVYFDTKVFLCHDNPQRFETFFLLPEILERIVWIDVIFFEFVHDNQHEEIHHNVGLSDDKEQEEYNRVRICETDNIKHNCHPIFTCAASE